MKWRSAGSDFLGPRGMVRSARGRKSRTDVAGTRSRAREAGSAFGQTSLYRTQMDAPVAKTHGMKTGGPNRFSHSDLKATGAAAKRSSP
jgi:hypothetical protein